MKQNRGLLIIILIFALTSCGTPRNTQEATDEAVKIEEDIEISIKKEEMIPQVLCGIATFSEYDEITVHCANGELPPYRQNKTWYEDEYTGAFEDEVNDVVILITAYQDNNSGEISYYMTYSKKNALILLENMPVSLGTRSIGSFLDGISAIGFSATITYETSPDYQGDIKLLYLDEETCLYCPAIISRQQSYADLLEIEEIGYPLEKVETFG